LNRSEFGIGLDWVVFRPRTRFDTEEALRIQDELDDLLLVRAARPAFLIVTCLTLVGFCTVLISCAALLASSPGILTNDQIAEDVQDLDLTIFVPSMLEVHADSAVQVLGSLLVLPLQLLVDLARLASIDLAELAAPERLVIAVDGIVRSMADEAEVSDVLGSFEVVSDLLVHLRIALALLRF
jgi:hypothetical protein